MKLAFVRHVVVAALEKVAKVVPTNKAVPILGYARLDAFGPDELSRTGLLWLSATDLVSAVRVVVAEGVVVKQPGAVLLAAHDFLGWLRSFTEPNATMVATTSGVQVKVGNSAITYKVPSLDQFPAIPDLEERFTHTLARADLLAALRLVKPAAATGAFHPNLEQVGIRAGKVQAADGIRYHEVDLPGTEHMDIALPLPFLEDLLNLGSVPQPTIDIGLPEDAASIIARLDGIVLTTARRRESFPDVSHAFLLPVLANTTTLRVSRAVLRAAVRHVRVMSDPATKAVRLQLSGSDFSTAVVSARQPSGAWAEEIIGVEWAGGDRTLVFNHEYLTGLLGLFEAEMLIIRLGEDARHKPSPALIQDGGRTGVLMQLRLDWT